jgi:hypothetical protein
MVKNKTKKLLRKRNKKPTSKKMYGGIGGEDLSFAVQIRDLLGEMNITNADGSRLNLDIGRLNITPGSPPAVLDVMKRVISNLNSNSGGYGNVMSVIINQIIHNDDIKSKYGHETELGENNESSIIAKELMLNIVKQLQEKYIKLLETGKLKEDKFNSRMTNLINDLNAVIARPEVPPEIIKRDKDIDGLRTRIKSQDTQIVNLKEENKTLEKKRKETETSLFDCLTREKTILKSIDASSKSNIVPSSVKTIPLEIKDKAPNAIGVGNSAFQPIKPKTNTLSTSPSAADISSSTKSSSPSPLSTSPSAAAISSSTKSSSPSPLSTSPSAADISSSTKSSSPSAAALGEVEDTSTIPETWFTNEFTETLDEFIIKKGLSMDQNTKFVSPAFNTIKRNIEELVAFKVQNRSLLLDTKLHNQKVRLAQLKKAYDATLNSLNELTDKLDREQKLFLSHSGQPASLWRLLELITRKTPDFFSSIKKSYEVDLPKYTYADFSMPNRFELIDTINDCIRVFGIYKTRCMSKLTQIRDTFDLNESELKLAETNSSEFQKSIAGKIAELDVILKFMEAHPNEYAYGLFVEDEFTELFLETSNKVYTRVEVLSRLTGETASVVKEYLQKNFIILQYCKDMLSFCDKPPDETTQSFNKMFDETYGSTDSSSSKSKDDRQSEDDNNLRTSIVKCIDIMSTEQDKTKAKILIGFATKNNVDKVKITKLIDLSIETPHFEEGSEKQKLLGHFSRSNIATIMLNHYLWFDYYECRMDLIKKNTERKQKIFANYDKNKCEEAFKDLNTIIGMAINNLLEIMRLNGSSSRDKESLEIALDNLKKGIQTINRITSVISQEPNPYKINPEMPQQKPFETYHHYVWKLLSYLQKPDIVKDVIKNFKLLINTVKETIGNSMNMPLELSDIEFYTIFFEDSKVKLNRTFSDIDEICTRVSKTLKYDKTDDLTEDIRSIEHIIDVMNQSVSDCVFGIALEPKDFKISINRAAVKLNIFSNTFSTVLIEKNLMGGGNYLEFLLNIRHLVQIFQNIIFFASPLKKETLEDAIRNQEPGGRGGKTRKKKQKRNRKLRKNFSKSKR